VTPVRWGGTVTVFGQTIRPGQLIHADKHGFLAIPAEDESRLLDAATFMDANECRTVIAAARSASGLAAGEVLERMSEAARSFAANTRQKFSRPGEW
jgi:regulator of RNase E activity RraA